MFIITAKLSGRKVLMGAAALAAIVIAVGTAAGLAKDVAAMEPVSSEHQQEQAVSTQVRTEEARIAYLKTCGWEVNADACTIRDVIIPEEFDENYETYAALQSRQGFDLARLKGKRVRQITYPITNYPGEQQVIAELLVYRGNVVAGDIYSMKADGGFVRGLMDHPQQKESTSPKAQQGSGDGA